MSESETLSDLVALVADRNTQAALRGVLSRHESLGIRMIRCDLYVHPQHDPGCLLRSQLFLKPYAQTHKHALVLFDRLGCGAEDESAESLEQRVYDLLGNSGWDSRAAVVVVDPEIEAWVWSDSPHVDKTLGWAARQPRLRDWLVAEGHLAPDEPKPRCPKEAMEDALRLVGRPRSSSYYQDLAGVVSLQRCHDRAFQRLRDTLKTWFGRD